VRPFPPLKGAATLVAMENLSDFALEQHRVYMLRDFEHLPHGDIMCSGFAPSNPNHVISACFPNSTLTSSWQAVEDVTRLPWPLEVISFRATRVIGKRFRFSLVCVDFQREWESEWPRLI
jgi:hypothetical protein